MTLDGSTIRELMHPDRELCAAQSLAEARVAPGARTIRHRHHHTEEFYHLQTGEGLMFLDDTAFPVGPGRHRGHRPPGRAHCIENTGSGPLVFLCCCAPAYSDEDTELLE
ncbi:MAG: cupin domain-containing protein [Gammaproteobacteria bacterium]|nr:cupin domain-containing protein [Gammaproteobacteria bacterium]